MTKILTEEQIDGIEQETLEDLEVFHNIRGFDKIQRLRNSLYESFYQIVEVRPGLCLEIFDDYRLEIARKLLQEQKQNVRTVVNTVGYANQSHFAAAFKRKFSITPQDCRLGRFLEKF